jgi:hypothetical protein
MPDPLNDPTGGDPPNPPSIEPKGNIICEFCECRITRSKGEVLEFSSKAKDFRTQAQTKEQLEGTIATLRQEKEALEARIREANPSPGGGNKRARPFPGV